MRNIKVTACCFVLMALVLSGTAWAQKKKTGQRSVPFIACYPGDGRVTTGFDAPRQTSFDVEVCAGSTDALAGFSLQWMTEYDYQANGGWFLSDDPNLCKASFSGNANGSTYSLEANQCTSVEIGDNLFDNPGASSNCADQPLECGTTYIVRAFAHADSRYDRSNFTADLICQTASCGNTEGCTLTQGYWASHGPIPAGNNSNEWPVTTLTLGSVSYTDLELLAILNTPAKGNGLLTLAHQLIAAKLNIANGAGESAIASAITDADTLIGDLVVPPTLKNGVPSIDFLSPDATSALVTALDNYNQGITGPGHCGN